tara:strand:- start:371 stop:631 length:261 start_codon:yes stop_codon:yes gene_type:complete
MDKQVKYVVVKAKLINSLDFEKKRGRFRVYLTQKDSIRYNINKFFFQLKRGIVKFRGETPKELEGYKQYTNDEILKKIKSSQWKIK